MSWFSALSCLKVSLCGKGSDGPFFLNKRPLIWRSRPFPLLTSRSLFPRGPNPGRVTFIFSTFRTSSAMDGLSCFKCSARLRPDKLLVIKRALGECCVASTFGSLILPGESTVPIFSFSSFSSCTAPKFMEFFGLSLVGFSTPRVNWTKAFESSQPALVVTAASK